MPKCSVRPYGSPGNVLGRRARPGRTSGSPSIVVLLLSARSAEPPHSSGSTGASASSTLPDALRVAMPFGSGGEASAAPSAQPSGSGPAQQPVEQLPCAPGSPPAQASKRRCHSACAARPRSTHLRGRARARSSVDLEALVRVEAEDLLGRRDLVGAERRAVGLAGVLLVRRRPADDRAQRDERGPVGLRLGRRRAPRPARRRPRRTSVRRRQSTSARASRRPRSARRRPRSARCWCRPRWRSGCRRRSR